MAQQPPYILGLDLGTSSVGWAMLGLTRSESGKPNRVLDAGVRIFEAGVEGDITQGKDSSRAAKRREARQPRRQNWRTQYRKRRLFELLQEANLLPATESSNSDHRQQALETLDGELRKQYLPEDDHDAQQKLTYLLRSQAAKDQVEPYVLGRAIYSLAQRRGYLSNRKSQDDDEREGVVSSSIGELQTEINKMGEGTTLAQYFAQKVKPADATEERIRRRYTARSMFQKEFDTIRSLQSPHFDLTEEQWDAIEKRIFFQRPLKSQKMLIGRCELEPDERRCPECLPIFQEFRILQKVNDLRVVLPDETKRDINEEERQRLIEALQTKDKLTARQAAKVAELPKRCAFSLEEHEGLDLIGHRTNVKMIKAFGDRWLEYSREEQDSIAMEVLHFRKPAALKKRAVEAWGLSKEQAETLAKTNLEQEYGRHSKKALEKLVGSMRQGTSYSTVRKAVYPEQFEGGEVHEILPPLNKWDDDIGNPALIRAMTELRKVVNCLIRKHGKPVKIHIEMARDLKNPREKRKDIHTKNQQNRKRREKAAEKILKEVGYDNPSRRDLEKWLLADECGRQCPYCGKEFGGSDLIGSDAEFNIEHIYPRRYLDDSYVNKTIACRKCNDKKGDRTPYQAFSGPNYDEILQRVKKFSGPLKDVKYERFLVEVPDKEFTNRHLNDTRYNAKLAANYLSLLYGGRYDDSGQKIILPTGQLTWMLRKGWQLDSILGELDEKNRDDHRHHAVDAVIVALSDQARINAISAAAARAEEIHKRSFLQAVELPWDGFHDAVDKVIHQINVSHRPTRTKAGPLHAESIYSKELTRGDKQEFRIRKALTKLTPKEISGDQIVDPVVRLAVQNAFRASGEKDAGRAFAEEANLPKLPNKNGAPVPIRKVRLAMSVSPRTVAKNEKARNVASGKDSNYASMVYAILDKNGKEKKWVHEIITRLDAAEAYSANLRKVGSKGAEKVLVPDEQEGKRRFKFALRKNDMLLLEGPDGKDVLYRVQSLSANEIQICEHNVPSITKETRMPHHRIRTIKNLIDRKPRLKNISPIGEYQ